MEIQKPAGQFEPVCFIRSLKAAKVSVPGLGDPVLPCAEYLRVLLCFEAMLLNDQRAIDFDIDDWAAWTAGKPPHKMRCQITRGSELTAGPPFEGKKTASRYDSRSFLDIDDDNLKVARENSLGLTLYPVDEYAELLQVVPTVPFFLTTEIDANYSTHRVVVDVTLDCWRNSPDVKAFAAFYSSTPKPYRVVVRPNDVSDFLKFAGASPRSGDFLPVTVEYGDREIVAVLGLERRSGRFWSRNRRRYEATIYLTEAVDCVPEATVLSRRVTWIEDGVRHREEAHIATVVESMR